MIIILLIIFLLGFPVWINLLSDFVEYSRLAIRVALIKRIHPELYAIHRNGSTGYDYGEPRRAQLKHVIFWVKQDLRHLSATGEGFHWAHEDYKDKVGTKVAAKLRVKYYQATA